MGRCIVSPRGREALVVSGSVRPSVVALFFGAAAAHYSLGDEVAIRSGVGCECGVDVVI